MKNLKNIFYCLLFTIYCLPACAQTWSALGAGIDTGNATVFALAMYNGELYAGGIFSKAGGVAANNITKWNGTNWSAVGNGMSASVYALCVYNGELYAGGAFKYADGKQVNAITKWSGTSWDSVGSGMNGAVRTLCVHNGKLYAGGGFTYADSIYVNEVAQWNGAQWDSVGGGIFLANSDVTTLTWYNNELYAGGYFNTAFQHIAKWDGINWNNVGGASFTGNIFSSSTYNGELFVGGDFNNTGTIGANKIASWDGSQWDSVGNSLNNTVWALANYNNKLYAGGSFWGLNYIRAWDGSNWSPLGSGLDSGGVAAFAVDTINDALYVGGAFTVAGGIPALKVAKWTAPSGINENNFSNEINIYPNPTSGQFQIQVGNGQLAAGNEYKIEIYNVLGEKVTRSVIPSGARNLTIDISSQPSGIYFLFAKWTNPSSGGQLNTSEGAAVKKIVKQ